MFDNTFRMLAEFKEEIFSQIPPEDKFIIDKHFDDIGEAFLGNYGYNNNTTNTLLKKMFQ